MSKIKIALLAAGAFCAASLAAETRSYVAAARADAR